MWFHLNWDRRLLSQLCLRSILTGFYCRTRYSQNEIFADRVTFVGIGGERGDPLIITRQPDIPGIAASEKAIIHMMTKELGFSQLSPCYSVGYENSLAFVHDDVAVFDLRPANVVETPEGLIIPIDSIPCRLDESARSILGGGI